jgi:hypothetical protein
MTTVSDGTTPTSGSSDTDTVALDLSVEPATHMLGTPYGELPTYHPEHVLPSEQVGRARRGTPSGAGRVVLPIALVAVSVVALGAGWAHLEADRAAEAAARTQGGPAAKPPVPALTPEASSSPAASTAPSKVPTQVSATASAPAASASPSAAATTPAPETSSSVNPATTVVDRSVPVVVYNATSRKGLAAKVADQLRAKGWKVVKVGNWTLAPVDGTTIFIKGEKDAAATMVDDLPAADSVIAPKAGVSPDYVTVVLGKDYPRT